jgi:hypothetical protein
MVKGPDCLVQFTQIDFCRRRMAAPFGKAASSHWKTPQAYQTLRYRLRIEKIWRQMARLLSTLNTLNIEFCLQVFRGLCG